MTEAQQKDLLVEWSLYGPRKQLEIIDEYRQQYTGEYCEEHFLDFLAVKLEIYGYWELVGLK